MATLSTPSLAFGPNLISKYPGSTGNDNVFLSTARNEKEHEDPDHVQPSLCAVEQFTIGWICALQEEYQAACQMLDEELEPDGAESAITNDESIYVFGKLGDHYVVVGCLPMGSTGISSATKVAADMARSFPNLKFALMVGIGGGAPNAAKKRDIRLGDVVVSVPQGQQHGVVQLDFGVRLSNGIFKRRGHLDAPPRALLAAIQEVQRRQKDPRKPDGIAHHIKRMDLMEDYRRPPQDRLYKSDYHHREATTTSQSDDEDDWEDLCHNCKEEGLVKRKERKTFRQVTIHYGTIASDNVVMRDAEVRDRHSSDDDLNILCFEMEAAGLMNDLRCLVIRGICDYADSHKNDDWHNYAALVAAAYARELLLVLRKVHVTSMPSWIGKIDHLDSKLSKIQDGQRYQNQMVTEEAEKAEEERAAAQRYRENEARHKFKCDVEALKERLQDDNQPSANIYSNARQDHHDGTCAWLFNKLEFKEWTDQESNHPILWLNGKHGAGKTVLCSEAIHHLSNNSPVVIYQFLANDDYTSSNRLFRIFAAELLRHILIQGIDALPASIEPFLNLSKNETPKLQKLVACLIMELPLTYIFIDGLDEVESSTHRDSSMPDLTRWEEDVKAVMAFLFRQAASHPHKLRVWCSSQPLPRIRNHMYNDDWKHSLREISITTRDTESDIMRYLTASVPDSTRGSDSPASQLAQLFFEATVSTDVEGSFLWASSMLCDLKSKAVTPSDLIKLARDGLPSAMSSIYTRVIERIRNRDGQNKKPPLWKIVLSLLTFAKRPLKMGEVIEAIAIMWTRPGKDLSDFQRVDQKSVVQSCISLVRYDTDQDDAGILRLSHSAVRKYLLENVNLDLDLNENGVLVTSQIIRDCCLRYLSQPRYAHPLKRVSQTDFRTYRGERITSHQFILYAAKYWFQHFDTSLDGTNPDRVSKKERENVKRFLYSPQFRTCIQVQSLFVTGHFLQRFDPITDRGILIRKTLPNWIQADEDTLNQQYLYFQGEWCQLLQFGRSSHFRGELDRCFWSALGPGHFLSHARSRYRSFQFGKAQSSENKSERCQVQQISQDGRQLMTAWIETHEEKQHLYLERWKLDGESDPQFESMATIPFSENGNHNLSRYSLSSPQSFRSIPLLPRVESVTPVEAVSIQLDPSLIRIGSKIYHDASGSYTPLNKPFGDSWEEVCVRNPFIVLCRQRIYKQNRKLAIEERERRRVKWMQTQQEIHSRSPSRARSISPRVRFRMRQGLSGLSSAFQLDDSDDASWTTKSNMSESSLSSMELPDMSPAEESWSDGSTSTDYDSSNDASGDELEGSDNDNSDSDIKSQLSGEDTESDIKSILSTGSEDEDDSESASIVSMSRMIDSSESGNSDMGTDCSEDEIIEAEPAEVYTAPQYPIVIGQPRGSVFCNCCNKGPLREWYHCVVCVDGDFHLCKGCECKGMWCLDIGHQLYRVVKSKPTGVVSRRMFSVRQELVVYRMENPGSERIMFHFRNKYPTMLHNSSPVIHPTQPLVVWSLCDSLLLFADFSHNTYFEKKIKVNPSKKAHQICANLSFSPCGTFLRVAIIDAVAQKPGMETATAANNDNARKRRLCLNLHVLVLRLSKTSPTKNPPKLVCATSCQLGCSSARPFIPMLPFSFTWTSTDLYLTISESYLRVYHVTLPDVREENCSSGESSGPTLRDKPSEFTITVPRETILLPRSSHNRSVQFFPPKRHRGNATVIIGPRCGYHPAPPIGVYLSEQDLGGWVHLDDSKDGGGMYNPEITLEDQLEEPWDEDNDCVLIPFDGY